MDGSKHRQDVYARQNDSADDITPRVAGPWGMFRRLRILRGGQIVEDIDLCGCLHEQFHMMKPAEKRINDAIEGLDAPLGAQAEQVVCFTPMGGLLSQENICRSGIVHCKSSWRLLAELMRHLVEIAPLSRFVTFK